MSTSDDLPSRGSAPRPSLAVLAVGLLIAVVISLVVGLTGGGQLKPRISPVNVGGVVNAFDGTINAGVPSVQNGASVEVVSTPGVAVTCRSGGKRVRSLTASGVHDASAALINSATGLDLICFRIGKQGVGPMLLRQFASPPSGHSELWLFRQVSVRRRTNDTAEGMVGADVKAVRLQLSDGRQVPAAIADGWYVAVWTGTAGVHSVRTLTGRGDSWLQMPRLYGSRICHKQFCTTLREARLKLGRPPKPVAGIVGINMNSCSAAAAKMLVSERLGSQTYTLVRIGKVAEVCRDGQAFLGAGMPPEPGPTDVQLSSGGAQEHPGHVVQTWFGRVGSRVTGLTLVLVGGRRIRATVRDGWYLGAWNGAAYARVAVVHIEGGNSRTVPTHGQPLPQCTVGNCGSPKAVTSTTYSPSVTNAAG